MQMNVDPFNGYMPSSDLSISQLYWLLMLFMINTVAFYLINNCWIVSCIESALDNSDTNWDRILSHQTTFNRHYSDLMLFSTLFIFSFSQLLLTFHTKHPSTVICLMYATTWFDLIYLWAFTESSSRKLPAAQRW